MASVLQSDEIESYRAACVLAIGIFDGLHLGHKKVLQTAREMAVQTSAHACVLTFDPHPSRVVPTGADYVEMIYPPELRAAKFAANGIECIFFKSFDRDFAALTPDEFAEFLRKKFPNLRGIVTGGNFLFGRKAAGNVQTLAQICRENGWKYAAVDGVESGGGRVSSTRLRGLLRAGDMAEYARLAGENYAAYGEVVGGKKLGRTIGFPTLNLPWSPQCKPPYGVYAVRLADSKGKAFDGVANYGVEPSVGGLVEPLLETHLFAAPNFGEGEKIKVEFLKFLRPEKKFPNLESLTAQIKADCAEAKSVLSGK